MSPSISRSLGGDHVGLVPGGLARWGLQDHRHRDPLAAGEVGDALVRRALEDDHDLRGRQFARRQQAGAHLLQGVVGGEPLRDDGNDQEPEDHHARDGDEPPVGAVPLAGAEDPADEADLLEFQLPVGHLAGGLLRFDGFVLAHQYFTRGSRTE